MLPRVAAVTMAYNEAVFLPIWARHYARQVGADQCYVVDHGSTEKLSLPPGMNSIRIPRSPHDDQRRADFVSDLTTSLLRYYDWVIYTDVDELAIADPNHSRDLPTFCSAAGTPDTVTAIGFDVQHVPAIEATLDPKLPIGAQRGWVRFTSAMCKPVLTKQSLRWSPGFHCSEHTPSFGRLYLFHLHWADLSLGLSRLRKTREMPWADEKFGSHQRVTDADWTTLFQGMADLPRRSDVTLDPGETPTRDWIERTEKSGAARTGQMFTIDLGLNSAELWRIPEHFRARL